MQPIGQPNLKTHRSAMALPSHALDVFVHDRSPGGGSFNVRIFSGNARP
jgi:hypothetical protein